MTLLLDLEIDATCWEYLAQRIVAHGGSHPPQPIVEVLDAMPPEEDEMPDDWDELTARAADSARWNAAMRQAVALCGEARESVLEMTERLLARMEE